MAVSFNYIPSNVRVPLFYAEVDNSMANNASAEKISLLIGLMGDGTATKGVPTLISSAEQAKNKFGRGSPLALMAEAFRNQNATGELWCLPGNVSTATAASGTVTLAGTSLESGTLSLYVGSELVAVSLTSGTDAADAATALVSAINADKDLPVKAEAGESDGEIKLTAKVAGVFGNDIIIGKNLQGDVGGESNINGLNMTVNGALEGGAGELDYEAAFAAVNAESYWFVGIQDASATALDAVKEEFNDSTGRWSYARMQYGHTFTTKRGNAEALVTFGNTRNDQHTTVFGIEEGNPEPTFIVTAAALGRIAGFITNDPARPVQTGVLNGLMQPSVEKRFSFNEKNTLLHNGIATIYYQAGSVMIERAITTYQLNSYGDADNSYLDITTLYTLSEVITRLKTAITSKYSRHKLANDGTRYGPGQAIVTPSVIRSELIAQYAEMERDGLVENATLFAKYLIVERNSSDVNRLDVLLPPDLVNQLRIFALQAQFRLQYSDYA